MKPIEETLTACEKILAWYYKQNDNSIPLILENRDKLSVMSYYIAKSAGDFKASYNKAYYIRKIAVSRKKQALIKEGYKIGEAQTEAENKTETEFLDELEKEGLAYMLEQKLRQINKVLEAMNQRIGYLKQEKFEEKWIDVMNSRIDDMQKEINILRKK